MATERVCANELTARREGARKNVLVEGLIYVYIAGTLCTKGPVPRTSVEPTASINAIKTLLAFICNHGI